MRVTLFRARLSALLGDPAANFIIFRSAVMAIGTVKWFNPTKGYGFIEPQEGGKDVFVHITAVQQAGLSGLEPGQKVQYELVTQKGGGKVSAAQLKLMNGNKANA